LKVFKEKVALSNYLEKKSIIGFVPTMGALHQGHISLIKMSVSQCSLTVCSIFVNPAQFNNKNDLLNYPRTTEKDLQLLEQAGCDVVFIPEANEMYPAGDTLEFYDFGSIEKVMEGEHRPGHFNGMANVVERLFRIVRPDFAFFGEKDFQQLCVVQQLVKMLHLPITIVPGKIIREKDGLAMSSRNILLSDEERRQAAGIYKTLCLVKDSCNTHSLDGLLRLAQKHLQQYNLIKPEYIQFANANDLAEVNSFEQGKAVMIFIAVWIGKVRLIDNMLIYE
jgi:pantoate--beta-alanine ligase